MRRRRTRTSSIPRGGGCAMRAVRLGLVFLSRVSRRLRSTRQRATRAHLDPVCHVYISFGSHAVLSAGMHVGESVPRGVWSSCRCRDRGGWVCRTAARALWFADCPSDRPTDPTLGWACLYVPAEPYLLMGMLLFISWSPSSMPRCSHRPISGPSSTSSFARACASIHIHILVRPSYSV